MSDDEKPPVKVAPLNPPDEGTQMPVQKGLAEDTRDVRILITQQDSTPKPRKQVKDE